MRHDTKTTKTTPENKKRENLKNINKTLENIPELLVKGNLDEAFPHETDPAFP